MSTSRQVALGSNNVQVIGSGNIVNPLLELHLSSHTLTHSLVHELLDIVYSFPASEDDSYSLRDPSQMHEKLRFNNAHRYLLYIDNHFEDYARVDEVMKDYPNSEHIVKKLRDMFIKVAFIDDDGNRCVGNGDEQLDAIKSELFETIVIDSKYRAENHPTELVEQFCFALIAYGVSKCKILETPV